MQEMARRSVSPQKSFKFPSSEDRSPTQTIFLVIKHLPSSCSPWCGRQNHSSPLAKRGLIPRCRKNLTKGLMWKKRSRENQSYLFLLCLRTRACLQSSLLWCPCSSVGGDQVWIHPQLAPSQPDGSTRVLLWQRGIKNGFPFCKLEAEKNTHCHT